MNGYSEFKIFGFDHILAIFFLIIISIFIPMLLKRKSRNDLYLFTSILALVIIANEFAKPFYYPYLFPERYEFFSMLPFHLCNLSSFLIAFHLLFNKKLLFNNFVADCSLTSVLDKPSRINNFLFASNNISEITSVLP